jgi:hypothetical protein
MSSGSVGNKSNPTNLHTVTMAQLAHLEKYLSKLDRSFLDKLTDADLKRFRDEFNRKVDQEIERRIRRPTDPVTPQVVSIRLGDQDHTLVSLSQALRTFGELNWIKEIPYGFLAEFADSRDADDAIRESLRSVVFKYDLIKCNDPRYPFGVEESQ